MGRLCRNVRRVGVASLLVVGSVTVVGLPGAASSTRAGVADEAGVFRIGPITLEPGAQVMRYELGVPRPDGDLGLQYMAVRLVDGDGEPVSHHDVHLHHVVFHNAARPDGVCPGKTQRFGGAGGERTPIGQFPAPYAYPVEADDRWDANYHLVDLREQGRPLDVFIEYELAWVPGDEATRPVTPYFLDVTGCGGDSTYDVPGDGGSGSLHVRTASWAAPADGLLVFAFGHLHDGGRDAVLVDRTNRTIACRSVASYGSMDELSMSTCRPRTPVAAGDRFLLASRYDNSRPYEDVMGIAMAYVWEG